MGNVRVSQAQVLAPIVSDVNVRVSQAQVFAVIRFPAEAVRVSQAQVLAPIKSRLGIRISQAMVMAIVRGRVEDPTVRVWSYTMDGHDFVNYKLGQIETQTFDTLSGEWGITGTRDTDLWRAYTGRNWQAGRDLHPEWSDVVVGDDGNGALYFLSPDDDTDDDPIQGDVVPVPFERQVTGQVIVKPGYASNPCYGVHLFGSIGNNAGTVNLSYSDDRGSTYADAGDVATVIGDYNARLNWLSLGSMTAPGRLFRITDEGALKRMDSLDMTP